MADVLLIMGSDSDLPVVEECEHVLKEFGVSFSTRVLSAHRTPDAVKDAVTSAKPSGVKVIIGFAGLAAHLPGVIASFTTLPVIGVPLASPPLNGLDSLYSVVQMPGGIPVATMAIGSPGAKNAGLFAVSILAVANPALAAKLVQYRATMQDKVLSRDKTVQARHAG
ncbi:MAG: 5-(carboxyamino)imidazole ribonucleotide mutase [Spirochaetes bacterium]|nr:5-(carboxyamino)imidazole ribonucleotide mutase [Spirochaetota bacterium]